MLIFNGILLLAVVICLPFPTVICCMQAERSRIVITGVSTALKKTNEIGFTMKTW